MTDIVANLKSNFSTVLILGGVGLGTGLLFKKSSAVKFGMIGAGVGAVIAALNIKPGGTRVGFDLFAHGVPAGGGDCRPGWCPGDQPQHHPLAQRGGRHTLSPHELEEHNRRMGGGGFGREHHHHHHHMPSVPMDAGGDDDDQMPFEPPPPHHHHHHHHPHQWW